MKAYVLLAEGFEEIEAITPIDVLRRAGIDVITLSISREKSVIGAQNIEVVADDILENHLNEVPDIIITPGGLPGSEHLKNSELVQMIIKRQHSENKYIASICASPIALERAGVIKDKTFTCYPGFETQINSGTYSGNSVEIDGNIITAKGPGVAMDFSLKIVETLIGKEISEQLRTGMIVQ